MTVCVAAIFQGSGIIGASDRMLTAGDIEFEPAVPKRLFLSSSCIALFAGDAYSQAEILQSVREEVSKRIAEAPDQWLRIRDIAAIYARERARIVRELAEMRVLIPFGLSMADYLARQNEFSSDFVRDIANELVNFESPEVEAIITGVDELGPHIFTVDEAGVKCCDSVGFASIGAGAWHANSQMMTYSHTHSHSLADTLLNVFFAKKRAEVAPGVGEETDMFVILGLGQADTLNMNVQHELEKRHEEHTRRQQKVADTARKKIGTFVQNIIDGSPQREQPSLPESASDTASSVIEEAS